MGLCATLAITQEILQYTHVSVAALRVLAMRYSLERALKMGIGQEQYPSVIAVSQALINVIN